MLGFLGWFLLVCGAIGYFTVWPLIYDFSEYLYDQVTEERQTEQRVYDYAYAPLDLGMSGATDLITFDTTPAPRAHPVATESCTVYSDNNTVCHGSYPGAGDAGVNRYRREFCNSLGCCEQPSGRAR
jgi:hypothetical protein